MDPLLPLLGDLALLLGVSAAVAYVGQRFFRVVPLVGFLLTGVLIGPNALGLVSDPHLVEMAAEIGVILLLFTIGIEFSIERLAKIGRLIFVGGTAQVALTGGAVALALLAFGVSWRAATYTGMLAALSSTVIVLKLLADRGATNAPEGQAALGILLFQDLAVILMVLLLPALAGVRGGAGGLLLALAEAAVIVGLVLVLARRLMPPFLERVARVCSPDIFLLTVVAICFGTAWLAAVAGIGVSLGAFLAGLIVSESRFSEHALSEVLPLRILFSAAFFVSIGMLLDPAFVASNPFLVLAAVAGVFAVKVTTTAGALHALRSPAVVSVPVALLLAQVGEFAFVLERRGAALGLYPAGSAQAGGQTFIATAVLLMIATPAFAALGPRLGRRLKPRGGLGATPDAAPPGTAAAPVLLGGYGPAAERLARYLAAAGLHPTVLTLSPDRARHAEEEGHRVIRGDYSRRQILALAGLDRARAMIVADDDLQMTERVVSVVRGLAPDIHLIAQTGRMDDVEALRDAGADEVVTGEGAADRELARTALGAVGVSPDDIALIVAGFRPDDPGVRLSENQAASTRCGHSAGLGAVRPRTPAGCEVCLAEGTRWVHLRLCMTCGHVGCCNDSPGRHAAAHHHETGHPVIRSWEPGEDWAWCYVDEAEV